MYMKYKRNERIGALTYMLTNSPNKIFTYNYFSEKLDAAKSTISEDIFIVKESIEKLDVGNVVTIPGASGGVKFVPKVNKIEETRFLVELAEKLSDSERITAGEFVFMTDIIYSPNVSEVIGRIFASRFIEQDIDYVVTIETKGIPMAFATARSLNVPLVVIRKDIKVTEGATVNVNYVSKSNKNIQSLSLARNSMKEHSKVLVIDDFMRGGGTLAGIRSMMKEFKSEIVGVGVLVSRNSEEFNREQNISSLLRLDEIDEAEERLTIVPNL